MIILKYFFGYCFFCFIMAIFMAVFPYIFSFFDFRKKYSRETTMYKGAYTLIDHKNTFEKN